MKRLIRWLAAYVVGTQCHHKYYGGSCRYRCHRSKWHLGPHQALTSNGNNGIKNFEWIS